MLHVGSILYNTHENTRDVNGTKAHITESVYVHMTGYAAQKLDENINDEWAKNTKLQRKKIIIGGRARGRGGRRGERRRGGGRG